MLFDILITAVLLLIVALAYSFNRLVGATTRPHGRQAKRIAELNAFGARAVKMAQHRRQYFGQEAEPMDLRYVSNPQWTRSCVGMSS